jgi:hypothetical protein
LARGSSDKTYTRLVEQVLAQLGESVPVVVLTGDNATLLFDGREQRKQVIPETLPEGARLPQWLHRRAR